MNKANIALDMANEQLNLAWAEIDKDDFSKEDEDRIATRLKMVTKLVRQIEREVAELQD
jgi:hypothetical protein